MTQRTSITMQRSSSFILPSRPPVLTLFQAAAQNAVDSAEAKAQRSYDSLRSSTSETATDAQRRYDQLRSSLSSDATRAREEAEKKKEEAKAGWFSWLGFGKSKAQDAKHEAATKIASGADDVKKSAEKRA
jgi:hypothetical protein